MTRLVTLVTPTILLIGLALLGLSDTDIPVVDTTVPDNDVTKSISKVSNSTASATIAITMTRVLNE